MNGAVLCCLWQSSRTKPALERISMPKVVLDVSSGVEMRDALVSSAATECNACAPSTICSVEAPGKDLEHYATGRRSTAAARVVDPNSAHAGATDGSRQAAGLS